MRRFHRVAIPKHAHPLVRRLFEEMNNQQLGVMDLCERAGLARGTLKGWRNNHCPRIVEIEACLNVLGLDLRAVKKYEKRESEIELD